MSQTDGRLTNFIHFRLLFTYPNNPLKSVTVRPFNRFTVQLRLTIEHFSGYIFTNVTPT